MTTGEKIKQLRRERGLTQEELGNLIGVQKAAINKYETGIVVNLKQSTILSIAEALHVSPIELLETDPYSPNPSSLDDDELRLVAAYRKAEPPIKKAALRMLEESAAEQESKKQDTVSGQTA